MSVNFARVIYSKDKVKKIVPIEFIKASKKKNSFYDPQHILDYDEKKLYYVKWFSCGNQGSPCQLNHSHPYEYYAAFIDCLSETSKGIMDRKTEGNRKRFPPKRLISDETSTEADHESSDSEMLEKNYSAVVVKKNLAKKVKKDNSNEIWKEHLNNNTKKNFMDSRPSLLTEIDTVNENDSSCLADVRNVQTSIPRKQTARKSLKKTSPEKENIPLDTDEDEERREIERMLLTIEHSSDESKNNEDVHHLDEYFADDGSLVNSENSNVESQEINKTATIDNSDSSSENSSSEELNYEVPYTIVGDYFQLATYKKVHRLSYDVIISKPLKNRSKTFRELAKLLYGENKLSRRCLKMGTVLEKTKEEFKVKPFEPEKFQYLKSLYRDYLKNKSIPKDLFEKVYWPEAKSILRYYIRDLRAKANGQKKAREGRKNED